ncbi:MAG: S8 family serine peptidase [Chloroflexi bacterium]|nr:S8 family serine peptidase [Chloroflexota bacterium]
MNALSEGRILRMNRAGFVQVYVHLTESGGSGTLDELRSMGAVIERQDESGMLVQASIPASRIEKAADLGQVSYISLPNYGWVNVGSQQTQGDALLNFDDLRAALGVSGVGITVGVISDGIFGLSNAISSGDLPSTNFVRNGSGKLIQTTGGVEAISFRSDADLEGGLSGGTGAEGTAMLEIVHDIAPNANLRFANFATHLEFNAAVDFLAANSDIVVDDIGWFGFAYDQTSPVSANTSDELNRPSNKIRGHYTSVGNQAQQHYEEPWVDSGVDGKTIVGFAGSLHRFQATSQTTDCKSVGLSTTNPIDLFNGQTATIFLTWDDTFGSAVNDYDIFIQDAVTGTIVASGISDNPGVTKDPYEIVGFTNTSGSTRTYNIYIQNSEDRAAPKTMEMFVFGGASCANGSKFNFNTTASSVPAQSDSGGGVLSVGAIAASDAGSDTIEEYSSRGPTNNGALKPDVTAIDGVSVTGSGGFFNPFFGTSAAAPHVAALAAFLLEVKPSLRAGESGDDPAADRAALRVAIQATTIDLGDNGADNTFGWGRVDGLKAGQSLAPVLESVPSVAWAGLLMMAVAIGVAFTGVLMRRNRMSGIGAVRS